MTMARASGAGLSSPTEPQSSQGLRPSGFHPSREVLECLWQYESDLLRPPTGDSLQRRLERVRAVIAKLAGRV